MQSSKSNSSGFASFEPKKKSPEILLKENQEINNQESKKQTSSKLIIKKADQEQVTKSIVFGTKEEE